MRITPLGLSVANPAIRAPPIMGHGPAANSSCATWEDFPQDLAKLAELKVWLE
jgi:hypothetical protein